jgi:hypothetical protein
LTCIETRRLFGRHDRSGHINDVSVVRRILLVAKLADTTPCGPRDRPNPVRGKSLEIPSGLVTRGFDGLDPQE